MGRVMTVILSDEDFKLVNDAMVRHHRAGWSNGKRLTAAIAELNAYRDLYEIKQPTATVTLSCAGDTDKLRLRGT